jgi:hypothetical protein
MSGIGQIIDSVTRQIRRVFLTPAQRRYELVGPPEHWEMKRHFQVDFLRRSGLLPHHYLVSIGCGVLRAGIPLIDYLEAEHFYGTEVRAKVLAEARKHLQESGLEYKKPQLVLSKRLADLSLGRKFNFLWAFSVVIHMDDCVLADALTFVARHMDGNGVFYANVDTANRPDGYWQGFPHVHRPLAFYQEMGGREKLSITDLGPLRDLGHFSGTAADEQRMLALRLK